MTGCQIESRTRENMWRYVYPMKKGFKFYICRRNTFVCKCLKLSNEKWSDLVTLPMWTLKDMLKLLTPSGTLSAVWIHLLTIQRVLSDDEVAEWLRRWTANPLGSARVGSNPILVEVFWKMIFSYFMIVLLLCRSKTQTRFCFKTISLSLLFLSVVSKKRH